jgi:hypothetical protein
MRLLGLRRRQGDRLGLLAWREKYHELCHKLESCWTALQRDGSGQAQAAGLDTKIVPQVVACCWDTAAAAG